MIMLPLVLPAVQQRIINFTCNTQLNFKTDFMKAISIKITTTILVAFITIICVLDSCVASKAVAAKSGAQLWAENCQRCHNTPSPSTFGPEQWKTVGMHMQTRALITNAERDKIVTFLQQSNY